MKKCSISVVLYLVGLSLLLPHPSQAQTATSGPAFMPSLPVMSMPAQTNTADMDLLHRFNHPIGVQAKTEHMDSQLAALVAAARQGDVSSASLPGASSLRVEGANVHVQIAIDPNELPAVMAAVEAAGGAITGQSLDERWLQGWAPILNLTELADHPAIHYLRHPASLTPLESSDEVISSEALRAFNVSDWRQSGRTGAGVRVAVIDGGFQRYRELLGRELPPTVTGINFVDGEALNAIEGRTSHGTAIAEIIYDIAPDAEFYLARINTNIDLKEAIFWLIRHEVDIISTSIGWYNLTPGDGSGEFADLVAMAHEAGILWVTAAGNDRENHWGGPFEDPDDDGLLNFDSTQEINYFGPALDQSYLIPAGYPISVYLRWSDWAQVDQDYDLHLMRWNGAAWEVVESSRNQQNGQPGQTPTEAIRFITHGAPTPYGILVERYRARKDDPPNLEIFIPKFFTPTQIVHARSLTNLADAPLVLTVSAVDTVEPYLFERYSSEGPTNGPGGVAEGGFAKPDIAAYANVTILSSPEKFNGTSAATPHVVGAAALIKSAYPTWTPAQVREYLLAHATVINTEGAAARAGHGRLDLGPAPARMAASTWDLVYAPEPKTGGFVTVTLTLVNSSRMTTEVSLVSPIPNSIELVDGPRSTVDPQPTLANGQMTWQGSIPANETVIIAYTGQVTQVNPHHPLRVVNWATITEANGDQTQLQLLFNPLEIFLPAIQAGIGD